MRKGVLFDLDGVLIDSEGLYTVFWEQTEAIYPTGIDNFAHYIKGSNLDRILAFFPENVRADIVDRIHRFDKDLVYPIFAGAETLLRELGRLNIPVALVTSSDPEKMDRLFSLYPSFRSYFRAIINGSMVSLSKPDQEGYLLGAKEIGLSADDCVVVEDSLQGLRAGKAAGAKVIGIATTLSRKEIEADADIVFDSISDVTTEILRNI